MRYNYFLFAAYRGRSALQLIHYLQPIHVTRAAIILLFAACTLAAKNLTVFAAITIAARENAAKSLFYARRKCDFFY